MNRTNERGAVINAESQKIFRLPVGTYVCIEAPEHGTQIVRQIRHIATRSETRPDFMYLDYDSFRLLGVEIADVLLVRVSDFNLDIPG